MKKPRLQDLTLRERIGQTQLTPDLGINFRRHDLNGSFRTDEETAEIMKNCQFGSFWMNNWLWVDENGELCPSGRRATAAAPRIPPRRIGSAGSGRGAPSPAGRRYPR